MSGSRTKEELPSLGIARRAVSSDFAIVSTLVLLGMAWRILVLATSLPAIVSDEAIGGLMAKHILAGERPVFAYDLPYHGSFEAYLTAGAFALLGVSNMSLRLVPLLSSTSFIWAIYLLGKAAYNREVGLLSAAYAAFPPPILLVSGLKANHAYTDVLLVGTMALVLAIRIVYDGANCRWRYGVLGVLSGLGFWMHPVALPYLFTISAVLLLKTGQCARSWLAARTRYPIEHAGPNEGMQGYCASPWSIASRLIVAGLGFALGCSPLAAWNATHGLATFKYLSRGHGSLGGLPTNLSGFARFSFPVLLGFVPPSLVPSLFASTLNSRPLLAWTGMFVGLILIGAVSWAKRRTIQRILHLQLHGDDRDGLLIILALVASAGFVFSKFGQFYTEPRWLLPIYSAIPLVMGAGSALASSPLRRRFLLGFFLLVVAVQCFVMSTMDPFLTLPHLSGKSLPISNQGLIAFLDSHGLDRIYADYWIIYRLAFETDERIVGAVIGPGNQIGWNRYVSYAIQVEASPKPAYIYVEGSEDQLAFEQYLKSKGITYRKGQVYPYVLYHGLSRRVTFPLDSKLSQ